MVSLKSSRGNLSVSILLCPGTICNYKRRKGEIFLPDSEWPILGQRCGIIDHTATHENWSRHSVFAKLSTNWHMSIIWHKLENDLNCLEDNLMFLESGSWQDLNKLFQRRSPTWELKFGKPFDSRECSLNSLGIVGTISWKIFPKSKHPSKCTVEPILLIIFNKINWFSCLSRPHKQVLAHIKQSGLPLPVQSLAGGVPDQHKLLHKVIFISST